LAYSIGLSLWVVSQLRRPAAARLPAGPGRGTRLAIGAVYMCAAVFGSYLGAIVIT